MIWFRVSIILLLYVCVPLHAEPRIANPFATLTEEVPLVAEATKSVLFRMTFPITDPGETRPHFERLFSKLTSDFAAQPGSELIVGAGPTGDALAYLQQKLLDAREKNPNFDAKEVLRAVIADQRDIPAIEVMGVGSDLDFLMRAPTPDFDRLRKHVIDRIKGTGEVFSPVNYGSPVQDIVFAKDDVKSFTTQMSLTAKQGGATFDHMTFSLSNGRFLDPPGTRIGAPLINEFLNGRLHHVAPSGESIRLDPHKQLARTMRVLTKFPGSDLVDDSVFRQDVARLREDVRRGYVPSEKMETQLLKIVRNGRNANGDNRFHLAAPERYEAEALKVIQIIEAKTGRALLPRVAEDRPLGGQAPAQLLDVNQFIQNKTFGDGYLYYAVPTAEHALGAMRGNFVVSHLLGANGADGAGVHLTGDLQEAQKLAGRGGLVLRVQINSADRSKLRIADWRTIKELPEVKALTAQARRENVHPFEGVAKALQLDGIVDGEAVWMQNARAIEPVSKMADMVEAWGLVAKNPYYSPRNRLFAAASYEQYYEYASALGENVPPPRTSQLISEFSRHGDEWQYRDALFQMLPHFDRRGMRFESQDLLDFLARSLKNMDLSEKERSHAIESILTVPLSVQDMRSFMQVALADPSHEVRIFALLTIERYLNSMSEAGGKIDLPLGEMILKAALYDPAASVRVGGWSTLPAAQPDDAVLLRLIKQEIARHDIDKESLLYGLQSMVDNRQRTLPLEYLPFFVDILKKSLKHPEGKAISDLAWGSLAYVRISEDELHAALLQLENLTPESKLGLLEAIWRYARLRGKPLNGKLREYIQRVLDTTHDLPTRIVAVYASELTDMTPAELKAFKQKALFDPSLLSHVDYKAARADLHNWIGGDGKATDINERLSKPMRDLFLSDDKTLRRQAFEHYGHLFFNFPTTDVELSFPWHPSSRMFELILPALADHPSPVVQQDVLQRLLAIVDSRPTEFHYHGSPATFTESSTRLFGNSLADASELFKELEDLRQLWNDWSVGKHGDTIHLALQKLMKSSTMNVRISALKLLFVTSPVGINARVQLIEIGLRDPEPNVRATAAELAARLPNGTPRLEELLRGFEKDGHKPVREAVRKTLAAIRAKPVEVDIESNALENTGETLDERMARHSLEKIEGILKSEARGGLTPDQRGNALRIFLGPGRLGMSSALQDAITKLLNDPHSDETAIEELLNTLRRSNYAETDLESLRGLARTLRKPEIRRILTANGQIPFNQAFSACFAVLKEIPPEPRLFE